MNLAHNLKIIENEEYVAKNPQITIVPTTPEHLRALALVLRPEDKQEILSFGFTPEKALWRSYKGSLIRKTAFIDDKIAAVWGVCGSFMGTIGQPYLLTSEEVRKISPLKFTRIYQKEVIEMQKLFPILENYADASYNGAIRLLGIVGFELSEPKPIGAHNALYRKFRKEA